MFSSLKSIFSKNKKEKVSSQEDSLKSSKDGSSRTKSPINSKEEDLPHNQTTEAYVDPVIAKLKSAKNVKDLYYVAEEIVGVNIENILDQSKSGETDDEK